MNPGIRLIDKIHAAHFPEVSYGLTLSVIANNTKNQDYNSVTTNDQKSAIISGIEIKDIFLPPYHISRVPCNLMNNVLNNIPT